MTHADTDTVAIVGGGVAGAALAWAITRQPGHHKVTVCTGLARSDATTISRGLVRSFEPNPQSSRFAFGSIKTLISDELLARDARLEQGGSVYFAHQNMTARMKRVAAELNAWKPDAARVWSLLENQSRTPATAIRERYAGWISPSSLRIALLKRATERGATLISDDVRSGEVRADQVVLFGEDAEIRASRVVICAGAWTPNVLELLGRRFPRFRTKQIQYDVVRTTRSDQSSVVDDRNGLFLRPHELEGHIIAGVGENTWDIAAGDAVASDQQSERAIGALRSTFPEHDFELTGMRDAAVDLYSASDGFHLINLGRGLFSFSGGSGVSAKSALARASHAAGSLERR